MDWIDFFIGFFGVAAGSLLTYFRMSQEDMRAFRQQRCASLESLAEYERDRERRQREAAAQEAQRWNERASDALDWRKMDGGTR